MNNLKILLSIFWNFDGEFEKSLISSEKSEKNHPYKRYQENLFCIIIITKSCWQIG